MQRDLIDIAIAVEDRPLRSSANITTVADYVVVIAMAAPDCAVTLTSCYLGQIGGDTAASHLLIAPGGPAGVGQRVLPGLQPRETHAQACLLDHAAVMRSALAATVGAPVQIDVGPIALQCAVDAWGT